MRKQILYYTVMLILWGLLLYINQASYAQEVTTTPAQIRLASATPLPQEVNVTPTFEISGNTATPEGGAFLQLREDVSEANVRSSPEILEENQVGVIREGERYAVLGRYFQWYQIQFDLAEDNRAWVYSELIEVVGDESTIPVVELNATPTLDPLVAGATQTREAILQQEGGALTITAQSRILQLPQAGEEGAANATPLFDAEGNEIVVKPTFTYPPGVIAGVPTLEVTRNVQLETDTTTGGSGNNRGLAPIVPIVVLALLGVFGLVITALRN